MSALTDRTGRIHLLFMFGLIVAACRPSPPAAEPPSGRMCVIDMGSNSFRRIVGTFANGAYTEHDIDAQTMGVGDDVEESGGRISDAKLAQVSEKLKEFAAACASDGVTSQPLAIGTAAFRDAGNGKDVIDIAAKAGIRMEIATEDRESELAYLVGSLGRDGYAVIDNGSRSIEFVARPAGTIEHRVYTLGYRIADQKFFDKSTHPRVGIAAFRKQLLEHVPSLSFMTGQQRLVGVEFMEMAEVLFTTVPEGHRFTLDQLKSRLDAIAAMPDSEVAAFNATEDLDRALPRLVTAVTMMEAFGYNEFEVTARQLGTGLIIEAGSRR